MTVLFWILVAIVPAVYLLIWAIDKGLDVLALFTEVY
jgi:hypothetical protein